MSKASYSFSPLPILGDETSFGSSGNGVDTQMGSDLSGTGDSQRDSRESFAIETPIFIARQADSHESLEFPIRANHPIRANRANRFARITPLRSGPRKFTKSKFRARPRFKEF